VDKMSTREILSTALGIVHKLAEHFRVPPCEVRIHRGIQHLRGRYHAPLRAGDCDEFASCVIYRSTKPRITLSLKAFTVDILLHEFAHHLQYCSVPEGVNPFDESAACYEHHGKEFFEELIRVTTAYYGDPARYDWRATEAEVHHDQVIELWAQAQREGIKLEPKIYPRGDRQPYLFKDSHDRPNR